MAEGNSVVSLNWDIAVETAAEAVGSAVHLPYPAHVPLEGSASETAQEGLWDAVPLLKVHGSMHWWFCPSCRTLFTGILEKGVIADLQGGSERYCRMGNCWNGTDRGRLIPAMVPPGVAKLADASLLKPLFAHIWAETTKRLCHADRWVVVGYSLPDTDMQFRMILRHALTLHPEIELVVVQGPTTDNEAWKRDYRGRLGLDPVRPVAFDHRGFVKWVQRCGPGSPPYNELLPDV